MTTSDTVWELTDASGTIFGQLEQVGYDMPWVRCRFAPTAAFARLAPLFASELALLEAERMDEWEAAYDAVAALRLALRSPRGSTITEFVLHVDGEEAWFRDQATAG